MTQMKSYQIYYQNQPGSLSAERPSRRGTYRFGMSVLADDVYDALRKANDPDYGNNPDVTFVCGPCQRTASGDIVVDSNGVAYYCNGMNLEMMSPWDQWSCG